ncbi:hypothetical protein R6Q57_011617 [Mikania cordata]
MAAGRCAKFWTMKIGYQKAVDYDILTKIDERESAERWIGQETSWTRLFDSAFRPSYREVTVEFLSTFNYCLAANAGGSVLDARPATQDVADRVCCNLWLILGARDCYPTVHSRDY